MPRLKKVPCAHCDAKLVGGVSFCTNCEQPTIWASHEERTEWELHQWSQKRSSRPKRRVSAEIAEVTPIQSRRGAGPTQPIVKHPAAQAAPVVSSPKARVRATKPAPERVTPPAAPEKKQVAKAKPERASARKAPSRPLASKAPAAKAAPAVPAAPEPKAEPAATPAPAVTQPASIDLPASSPAMPDHAAEQTAILRELLKHVISIEEKINGNGSRRLRLLKRSG
jgi:hypothetical protein